MGLLQRLERVNASSLAARVKKTDAREIESYYGQYYENYVGGLDKGEQADSGATRVTGAFNKVAKATVEVGQHTKEKVSMAEDKKRRKMVDEYAEVHLSESPKAFEASEHKPSKPAPAEGLIL